MTTVAAPADVLVPRAEMDGLMAAMQYYLHAFTDPDGPQWGAAVARAAQALTGDDWRGTLFHWFGRNHQQIAVGDTVRVWDWHNDPDGDTAEVLVVTHYAALIDCEHGAEWIVWPLLSRLDRAYQRPDFNTDHWVPVSLAIGMEVPADSIAEYQALLDTQD